MICSADKADFSLYFLVGASFKLCEIVTQRREKFSHGNLNILKNVIPMRNKLAALIEVRKIVTLVFTAVFSYLATTAQLSAESVLAILTMVFGYYFGKSTALDEKKGNVYEKTTD